MRKRISYPDVVTRLSKKHNIPLQEASELYNNRIKAKARTDSEDLYQFAQGLSKAIKSFRNNKQLKPI